MSDALRIGVIGGGLIAQAVHLPNLATMPDRFSIEAIADPSRRVRDALAAKYSPARPYAEWRELLERETLDALVLCAPHVTHADVSVAALDCGLHVFVEKPLCIAVEDADAIVARARSTGLVVQVGYMKRYAKGYQAFIDGLPTSAVGLRLIDVVTYDPWMAREPFVPWSRMTQAEDLPAEVTAAAVASEREQVGRAVGAYDSESVREYSYTFLACLVHDVNLVNGALDRLGLSGAVEPRDAAAWANGDAAAASLRLPGGGLWRTCWMLLRGLENFEERARLFFDDGVHELELPVPYHTDQPVHHRVTTGADGAQLVRERSYVDDPYLAELEHFHACVTRGEPCRTPPEQAREDLVLLRDLFLRRDADSPRGG